MVITALVFILPKGGKWRRVDISAAQISNINIERATSRRNDLQMCNLLLSSDSNRSLSLSRKGHSIETNDSPSWACWRLTIILHRQVWTRCLVTYVPLPSIIDLIDTSSEWKQMKTHRTVWSVTGTSLLSPMTNKQLRRDLFILPLGRMSTNDQSELTNDKVNQLSTSFVEVRVYSRVDWGDVDCRSHSFLWTDKWQMSEQRERRRDECTEHSLGSPWDSSHLLESTILDKQSQWSNHISNLLPTHVRLDFDRFSSFASCGITFSTERTETIDQRRILSSYHFLEID